ncbi:mechanosensitive ion channel family protein [Puia sp. P3]|uniref:mechanosensitive ion channel family protein n=1 Tax=Puia sp. P3 TaxID=3423952 RepID=UPI003D6713B1
MSFLCFLANAQDSTKTAAKDTIKTGKITRKKTTDYYRENYKHVRRKFDSTLFTNITVPTSSDYAEDIENVYQLLNKVPLVTESFTHLDEIDDKLDDEDSALTILKDRMSQSDRTFHVQNLQMFNMLLDALNQSVRGYSKYLNRYDSMLDGVRASIEKLKKDSLMLHILRDSALSDTFKVQLQALKAKWRQADSLVTLNGQQINSLKSEASAHTIAIVDLLNRVDQELAAVGTRAFGKERRYLWEPRSQGARNFTRANMQKSLDSERQLARFYFSNTRSRRSWLLLAGAVFFFWIWWNFRTLRRMDKLSAIEHFHFRHINPYPIAASLVFLLTLAPLADLHAPAIYIESVEFLLMVVLTFVFWKSLPRNLFYGWCIFLLLFLLLPLVRLLGMPLSMERWATFIIDSASCVFACFFLFGKRKIRDQPRLFQFAIGLYLFFNFVAVVFNLFGRVTLSQICASTAVYSFAETASLAVFVRSVVEAFLLQIQSSRIRKKYPENFDLTGISKNISRMVITVGIVLWFIVLMTNLDLFDAMNDLLVDVFTSDRSVGNFSFTLGGLVLFLGIIWLANFLQKYIAYFFGDTGDDASLDDRGQRSRLLVTRLVLLIGGFLLAVAASGLSVDRITVILGALGVGVGLGLQNIVNNFVSGIILIFDRPVRIGDTVELGDKKGRVKEISIRTSTLLTDEGAEVIIPNGDVLSSRIVNWTLSNSHVRLAITFNIEKPVNPEIIKEDPIKDIVRKHPNVLKVREPQIILNTINSKTQELQVYFWIDDITKTPYTTGELRTAIYRQLDQMGVTVL